MKLNIKKTIKFFDEIVPERRGHISAIIGMIGEELALEIFKHFYRHEGFITELTQKTPKTGKSRGPWLDAWLFCQKKSTKFWYQVEIKNWSAFAIGGYEIKYDTSEDELKEWAQKRMKQQKTEHFENTQGQPNKVTKVLVKMQLTDEEQGKSKIVKPLLIFWMPISAESPEVFSRYQFNKNIAKLIGKKYKNPFDHVDIFSASLYLRKLYKNGKGKKFIDIKMPVMEYRNILIESIFR